MDRLEDGAPVAVIGGGYAGCAAAATLAAAGVRCTVYEAAPFLGGRARRVVRDGLALDNGQHLLLGAYRSTLALVRQVAPHARAFRRRPLAIVPFASKHDGALSLVVRRAPARLGLALGMFMTRGLTLRERLANVAWLRALERGGFRRPAAETVAALLTPLPRRVREGLWEPLCLAALNTPPAAASAQVFANVLQAAFGHTGADADFVFPTVDLSAFLPEAAARYVGERGGAVEVATTARLARDSAGNGLVVTGTARVPVAATILAVGPHRLAAAVAPEALAAQPTLAAAIDSARGFAYEPLATVWLGYAARSALSYPIARLDDAPGQWVVDRSDILAAATTGPRLAQLLSVVISASGAHLAHPQADLVRDVDAQLRRLRPDLPHLAWSFAIVEKRATYACTPSRPIPTAPRVAPGVYLAGDYAYPEFPATLEAAVRSGIAAAQAFLEDRRSARSVSHP